MKTIRGKLMLAIVTICLMVGVSIGYSIWSADSAGKMQSVAAGIQRAKAEMSLAKSLQLEVSLVWQYITDASLTKDRAVIDEEAKPSYDRALKIIDQLQDTDHGRTAEGAAIISSLKNDLPAMWNVGEKMFAAYRTDWKRGNVVMEEFDKACDRAISNVSAIVRATEITSDTKNQQMIHLLDRQRKKTVAVAIIMSVLGLFVIVGMFMLNRAIDKPLQSLSSILEDIADGQGDLTVRLPETRQDELGKVSRAFNRFVGKMQAMMLMVAEAAVKVSTASQEVNNTASTMATAMKDVEAQAGGVAAAGEEMATTAADIARNCSLAADSAREAGNSAATGAGLVEETVQRMEIIAERVSATAQTVQSLGARSDHIGAIISTIKDIADQTNLLALNAAIEAARAGEQGRGFAVVADAVRALAERTAKATGEISQMILATQQDTSNAVVSIHAGVNEVAAGSAGAARSGEVLKQILLKISEVTNEVGQMAVAAEEQSATTGEVNNNIHRIVNVLQGTGRNIQEAEEASRHLLKLAEDLRGMVGQFKVAT